MNSSKCIGFPRAIEYNEKYVRNAKFACYCNHCNLTVIREATPYKIIQTENGVIEEYDYSFYETKNENCEEIPTSDNPNDPWGSHHRLPTDVLYYKNKM